MVKLSCSNFRIVTAILECPIFFIFFNGDLNFSFFISVCDIKTADQLQDKIVKQTGSHSQVAARV